MEFSGERSESAATTDCVKNRNGGLLIEAEDVASRITKPGGDLGKICSDGLHDLSAVGDDQIERCSDSVDHNVDYHTRGRRQWPTGDPRAADLANTVVKCDAAVAALPNWDYAFTPASHKLSSRAQIGAPLSSPSGSPIESSYHPDRPRSLSIRRPFHRVP